MKRWLWMLCLAGAAGIVLSGCVKRIETPKNDSNEIIIDKAQFMALAKVRVANHDSAMAAGRFISPVINPGDQLALNIYEKLPVSQDKRIELKRVSESGTILLPPIGVVNVAGLTVSAAAKMIEEKLSKFIVSPYCELEISQRGYQPHFYVFGEVGRSGAFALQPGERLIDAISEAGGCNNNAYRRSIKLLRMYDQKVGMLSINLIDIMSNGQLADNIDLQDQDIVFVPRRFLTNFGEVATFLGQLVPWYLYFNQVIK